MSAQSTCLILEAKHLVWGKKIVTTMAFLGHEEGLHLSLHSVVLGFLVHFLDHIATTCRRQSLVSEQSVDFLLHACFLLF